MKNSSSDISIQNEKSISKDSHKKSRLLIAETPIMKVSSKRIINSSS